MSGRDHVVRIGIGSLSHAALPPVVADLPFSLCRQSSAVRAPAARERQAQQAQARHAVTAFIAWRQALRCLRRAVNCVHQRLQHAVCAPFRMARIGA
eukprot:5491009-Pleurochrysis_carterae.AAC.2